MALLHKNPSSPGQKWLGEEVAMPRHDGLDLIWPVTQSNMFPLQHNALTNPEAPGELIGHVCGREHQT